MRREVVGGRGDWGGRRGEGGKGMRGKGWRIGWVVRYLVSTYFGELVMMAGLLCICCGDLLPGS